MEEHATMMKVLTNSIVLASHSIVANVVRWIGVIFINVKIMETALLLLSMTFQHQNANAQEITVEQLVALTFAQILNAVMEFVLVESASVMKTTSMMETFV